MHQQGGTVQVTCSERMEKVIKSYEHAEHFIHAMKTKSGKSMGELTCLKTGNLLALLWEVCNVNIVACLLFRPTNAQYVY